MVTLLGDLHCGCAGWNGCFPFCGWSVYKSKPDLGKHSLNIHILTRASVCLFQCGANLLYHSVFVCAAVPQTCLCLISWIKHTAWWSTYCTICGDSFLFTVRNPFYYHWHDAVEFFSPVFLSSCLHPFFCSTGNSCPDLKAGGNGSTWSRMRPVRVGRISRTLPTSHRPAEAHKEVSLTFLVKNTIPSIFTQMQHLMSR